MEYEMEIFFINQFAGHKSMDMICLNLTLLHALGWSQCRFIFIDFWMFLEIGGGGDSSRTMWEKIGK
jgi:hypothetical protein